MNSAPHEFEPFIRYIRFPRYKQLAEDERIDFEFPFTALVGPNGCNKSAVLQALYGCPEGNNTGIYWFSTDVDVISEKSGRHCFIHGYWSDNANDVVEAVNYPSLRFAQEGASKSKSKVTELPGS
jgi:ABC-type cobalamin/Fe3+-siderophores transport system ATPase subunit